MKTILVVVLWLVTAWRTPSAWQEPWKRALWVTFAALAASLTLSLHSVVRLLDSSGIPALATLCRHATGIVACAAVLEWVTALTRPDARVARRERLITAVATVAIMTTLFVFIPRHHGGLTDVMAGNPLTVAYLLVFETYLGLAMMIAAVMFIVAARQAGSGLLSWGLWILWAGTSLGVLYAVIRSLFLIQILTDLPLVNGTGTLLAASEYVQLVAVTLIVVGSSLPAADSMLAMLRDYRNLNALRPLWSRLTNAAPQVILGTPPSRFTDRTSVADLRVRLLRRTIEIRDARLALRGYVSGPDLRWIRDELIDQGLAGEELDAAVEAAWLSAAIIAHRRGRPAQANASPASPGGNDLASEVRWLRLVSDADRTKAVTATSTILIDRTAGEEP